MKKIIMCSMLVGAMLPSVAFAAPSRTQIEQSTCRTVAIRVYRNDNGDTETEYVVRCTTRNGVT
jgi:hypothetical protein